MLPGEAETHSVLVVDDTTSNRLLYSTLLTRAGYRVRCASTGDEALAAIAERPPTLVLLDFMMPGMDGGEVVRRLRSESATRELPIVVLTASVASEDIERALHAGADDYINKPVDSRILLTRIRSIIRAHEDRVRASAEPERDALRRELAEAQAVQRAQLPSVPVIWPGWHVIGAVVPSGQIAGDVFDVTRTPDGRGIVALVDVSGHGTASALVAAETRTGFRELVANRSLVTAVSLLNQRMVERDTGKYSCVGAVQVHGRNVSIVNAGLPPIILIRHGHPIASVVASGFPVGLFPAATYREERLETEPGDSIVLVSDGLTEPFGETDDVVGAIERMQLCPPLCDLTPELLDTRLRKAAGHDTGEPKDDATIVVLECT